MNNVIKSLVTAVTAVSLIVSCNNDSTTKTEDQKDTSKVSNITKDTMNKMDNMSNMKMDNGAMNSMMDGMKAVKMTGDFDIDFANVMIEHHKGAVEMSGQEINSGKDEKIKSMAQKIITSQKEEIAKLQDFVKSYKPSGMKHGEGELSKSMSDMESKMKNMQMSGDMDKDFATMMIEHHEGAIAMSKKELANGMTGKLKQIAQKAITEQNKEIKEFKSWLERKK